MVNKIEHDKGSVYYEDMYFVQKDDFAQVDFKDPRKDAGIFLFQLMKKTGVKRCSINLATGGFPYSELAGDMKTVRKWFPNINFRKYRARLSIEKIKGFIDKVIDDGFDIEINCARYIIVLDHHSELRIFPEIKERSKMLHLISKLLSSL